MKPKTKQSKEKAANPFEAQVIANSAATESILNLLRFIGPGLVGLSPDPAGVEHRLRELKGTGGHRAGELMNADAG